MDVPIAPAYHRHLPRASLCVIVVVVLACLTAWPAIVSAQSSQPKRFAAYYGIAGGAARQTTSGTFLTSALPAGAPQPESDRTAATLGLLGGIKAGTHVAVIGLWDQVFGGDTSAGNWGTMTLHGAIRVWLAYGVWVEVGGGASELGYKPPPNTAGAISRFWAPGVETAAGMDVLRGRRVAINVFARYSAATFNGLQVSSLSLQIGLAGRN